MCRRKISSLPVAALALGLAALLASPADALPAGQTASARTLDLDEFPRHRLDELAPRHRDFIERVARWIITDDEREVFLRLPDEQRRDLFIEEFWRRRDPTPGTRRNEYREQHMRRLDYASRIFSRGSPRPGWMTDRGRIYILLGEPQRVDRFPNTQLSYPLEYWFYNVDTRLGLPGFFYVAFFKRNGVGEYRLYSPLGDGPEALLNPTGQNQAIYESTRPEHRRIGRPTPYGDLGAVVDALKDVDAELARVAVSLIPASGATLAMAPVRSEMLLARIEDLPNRIMADPSWAFAFLTGSAKSDVRFETLPVQAEAVAWLDPSGGMFVHYAVRADAGRLNLVSYEDTHALTFSLSDSLSDEAGRLLDDPAPRSIEAPLEADALEQLRRERLTIVERIPAIPGRYTLGVVLENNVSHEFGRAEIELDVPRPNPARLDASAPILVADHQDLGDAYDPFGKHYPFQIGRNFLLPAMDGPFPVGGTIWIFQQVWAPPEELQQRAARYELVAADGTVVAARDTLLPLERKDRFGALNQLAALPLEGVAPGEYTVRVTLDLGQPRTWTLPARVVAPDRYRPPLIQAQPQPGATDVELLLRWAREFRTVGQIEPAIVAARQALEREPESAEALELVSALLLDAGRLDQLVATLTPRLVERPRDLQLLRQLAEASARLGRHRDAVRYWERARLAGAEDTPDLLNALAAEYLELGDSERARELLERSLERSPNQAVARRLLDRIDGTPQRQPRQQPEQERPRPGQRPQAAADRQEHAHRRRQPLSPTPPATAEALRPRAVTAAFRPPAPRPRPRPGAQDEFPTEPAQAFAFYESRIGEWADGPVSYLMLRDERKQWGRLTGDEARRVFIAAFWQRRDPDLRDRINPLQVTFYTRVAQANDRFQGLPRGWRSDRGRTWVLLGPPDSIRSDRGAGGVELREWIYHAPGLSPALSDIPNELHVLFARTRRGWEAVSQFGEAGSFPAVVLDVFERIRNAAVVR